MASDNDLATAESQLGVPRLEAAQRSSTQTSTQLTEKAGFLRHQVRQLSDDTQGLHLDTQLNEWTDRAMRRGKEAPLELLGHLSDLGFSWRDIARMVRVSVPSVQKWRRGGKVTGDNRRMLANLVAACDLITEDYLVSEVASWFEMPLVTGIPVTPVDLYAQEQYQLLFDYAGNHTDTETVLNQLNPDWRQQYSSDFEVFAAEDGQLSIRTKG
ncbi:hypothetical protein [Longivirga aurantiaca]|uniref:HTH cro/C1-type domain-containing protein n=1 Tax=Longivirga aurantiaca TaxID=1837743 RepID=A0ABW1T6J3_9ACTN